MLLDTCALLWLSQDENINLSGSLLKKIDNASAVYVSSITAFEIALKNKAKKLTLPAAPLNWFKAIIDNHRLSVIDLSLDICIKAANLPLIHKDPCDRFIIATAIIYKLPVVTADKNFEKYDIKVIF